MTKFIFKAQPVKIVLNQEGITLIGNVYVEGPLTEDSGAADGVSPFETTVNDSITPNTYYSTRLDVYDVYGRCNEKKSALHYFG